MEHKVHSAEFVVFYRISSNSYPKVKPSYITKETCLRNFVSVLHKYDETTSVFMYVIADNCTEDLLTFIETQLQRLTIDTHIEQTSFGNGAASFRRALGLACALCNDTAHVYMVEDDYLHLDNSIAYMREGLLAISPFVSAYDAPDKYGYSSNGTDILECPPNPFVEHGTERGSTVRLSRRTHWKITCSLTMTFMTHAHILKKYRNEMLPFIAGTHPHDFDMFLHLISCFDELHIATTLPGLSTHGESMHLTPLVNWEEIANIPM
jgi:hypothetical protein